MTLKVLLKGGRLTMNLTDHEWAELRKLLNKAWDERDSLSRSHWIERYGYMEAAIGRMNRRYRDVTKIIEGMEKQRKDGSDVQR